MVSPKGWSNNDTMCKFLLEVLLPYTKGRLCCMTWDTYGSHLAEEVVALAHKNNVHIIPTPPGGTSKGALDASANGEAKSRGKKLWRKDRLAHPYTKVDCADALSHAITAYYSIAPATYIKGFEIQLHGEVGQGIPKKV